MTAYDPTVLPDDLPAPVDDGAAAHLWDMPLPPFELAATDGSQVRLVDPDGGVFEVQDGPIVLCRCGRSQTKPFCDESHRDCGFTPDSP